MTKMAWKRIKNRKTISIITVLAMLTIFMSVSLGIQYAQQSKVTVEQTIENFGRGSYDILVRPSGSRTSIEETLGVVEENYIGDGLGGISLDEWEAMKQRKDVEVAAPVASLGYFSGDRTAVHIPLLDSPARLTWQYTTSDGLNRYPVGEESSVVYFETIDTEELWEIATFDLYGDTHGFYMIMPESHYLLTAIDVESEEKLTGIDFKDLYRELEGSEEQLIEGFLEYRENPPVIPILQRNDLNIPLHLSLKVEELDISLDDYKKRYDVKQDESLNSIWNRDDGETVMKKVNKELSAEKPLTTNEHDLDLSAYQSPYAAKYVEITPDFKIEEPDGGGYLSNDTGIYYTASKVQYDVTGEQVKVAKVEEGNPPLYKGIVQQGQSYLEELSAPFMLWKMGDFSPDAKGDALVSSPLGIYSPDDVKTADGTALTPTLSPGSFIASPAAGITTLEAAELIKGETPIDAIRIRVAGIESYDEAAQLKIENLATDLLDLGYEVDIVAGSSFKEMEMDVEGIGLVTSTWTTLGVAQSLTSSWNMVALLNTVLFALYGIAWFASRLLFERSALAAENDVLYTLGWRKNKIRLRNFTEQQILISSALILSIIALLFFDSSGLIFLIPVVLWLATLCLAGILFRSESKPVERTRAYKKWASLLHYRQLIIPTMLVLTISILLIAIQAASLLALLAESLETSLGEFTMDATLNLQFFVLFATILLALISVGEAINAILNARKTEFEMYHTIGWTRSMIRKHFSKEVALWAGVSVVIGGLLGIAVLFILGIPVKWIVIGLAGALLVIVIPLAIMVGTKKYR